VKNERECIPTTFKNLAGDFVDEVEEPPKAKSSSLIDMYLPDDNDMHLPDAIGSTTSGRAGPSGNVVKKGNQTSIVEPALVVITTPLAVDKAELALNEKTSTIETKGMVECLKDDKRDNEDCSPKHEETEAWLKDETVKKDRLLHSSQNVKETYDASLIVKMDKEVVSPESEFTPKLSAVEKDGEHEVPPKSSNKWPKPSTLEDEEISPVRGIVKASEPLEVSTLDHVEEQAFEVQEPLKPGAVNILVHANKEEVKNRKLVEEELRLEDKSPSSQVRTEVHNSTNEEDEEKKIEDPLNVRTDRDIRHQLEDPLNVRTVRDIRYPVIMSEETNEVPNELHKAVRRLSITSAPVFSERVCHKTKISTSELSDIFS